MIPAAALLPLFGAAVQPAPSPKDDPAHQARQAIGIMCDPVKFRFSVEADVTAAELDRTYPNTKIVPIDDLFFRDGLPGWTGQIEILAPLIRYERCGPYTVKLEGAAYNLNVQGESGAYEPFASVTVLRGNSRLYPKDGGVLRLTACDRTLPRARPCPDGYAIRLEAHYDDSRKILIFNETATSFDDAEATKEKTTARQFNVPENLDMWHPN